MKKNKFSRWRFFITDEDKLVIFLNKIQFSYFYSIPFLKQMSSGDQYNNFYIPKKQGGFRLISSPYSFLKHTQECISLLFETLYQPNENTFGFISDKSIVDKAYGACFSW